MFSFLASNAPGPKRQRPIGPPQGYPTSNATVPEWSTMPESLGHEYIIDTKAAPVALRNQMRVELAEIEEDTRREARHLCRAPARRGEFLLAASILVQRRRDLSVEDALALAQSQFVEQRVRAALLHTQEKWKLIFEKPPEFLLYDQRQEELMKLNSQLDREARHDESEARARVCKLCMFLTAGGKYLKEWKAAFADRAVEKRNGGIWTPNQFAIAVGEIARSVSGCTAPEGLAATIYEYMDMKSTRLVEIDEFFSLCRVGMRLEAEEKRAKALKKARVEQASKAASKALNLAEEEEEVGIEDPPSAPEDDEKKEKGENKGSNNDGSDGNFTQESKEDEAQFSVGAPVPSTLGDWRAPHSGDDARSVGELADVTGSDSRNIYAKSASEPLHSINISSMGETKLELISAISAATDMSPPTGNALKENTTDTSAATPIQFQNMDNGEQAISPYVFSPVHNHIAERAIDKIDTTVSVDYHRDNIVHDLGESSNLTTNNSDGSNPTITASSSSSPSSSPSSYSYASTSPWGRVFLQVWTGITNTLSPFKRARLKAQMQKVKEKEQAEEKLRMQEQINDLQAALAQVCMDAALQVEQANAARAAALEATRVAKVAEMAALNAAAKAAEMAAEQQAAQREQKTMAAAIQSAGFVIGQKVRARFAGRGHFYPAVITGVVFDEARRQNVYDILYADGDREKRVDKKHLRLILL